MRGGVDRLNARLSPDGMYYWDGVHWISTLSPDGRRRWNGSTWEAIAESRYPSVAYQAPPKLREPTSWTKPLQIAVIASYAAYGVYELFVPFWMSGYLSQAMQQSLARQQQAYPPGEAPPPAFNDMVTSMMTAGLWIGVAIAVTIAVIAIIGAWKRWTWAYYAVLVVLGLGVFGFVFNLINLASGGVLTARSIQPPEWTHVANYVSGTVDATLFVWMLVALIRRGPWGMRRVS